MPSRAVRLAGVQYCWNGESISYHLIYIVSCELDFQNRDVKLVFLKFEFRLVKFELNSNFVLCSRP